MAFRTIIVTEDITVVATSDKGAEYDMVITCINRDPHYTDMINVGTVTPFQLAALHMLMIVDPDKMSSKLVTDLYEIVQPILAICGDTECRPIP